MSRSDRAAGPHDARAGGLQPRAGLRATAETMLFAALAGTLAARLMIGESYYRVELGFLNIGAAAGPSPALSVLLDWALLAGASITCLLRPQVLTSSRVGLAGGLLLSAAVIVSALAAADTRIALSAGAGLVCICAAGAALRALMRTRMLRDVLVAALLAGCATNALKCITQRAYEFRETYEFWQQEQAGLSPEARAAADPLRVNYERRLRSNAAFGYLTHSNVTASCLALGALLLAALLRATIRAPALARELGMRAAGAAGLLALTLIGLWCTDSTGGWIALAAGGLVLGGAPLLSPRWRSTLVPAGYLLLAGGMLSYGLLRGTLPGESLAFRWEYWTSGWHAWLAQPLTGCGRENFIQGYLLHRAPGATEEVRNPHSLWLSLLYELGPLGLLGGGLLAWAALRATSRLAGANADPNAGAPDAPLGRAGWSAAPAALCALVALGWTASTSDLIRAGASGAIVWGFEVGGAWLAAFALLLWLLRGTSPALATAGMAALVAALTHGLIDFALLTAAGLSLLVGLLAGATAGGAPRDAAPRARGPARRCAGLRRAARAIPLLATAAYLLLGVVPTWRAALLYDELQAVLRRGPGAAATATAISARAVAADPWSADAPRALAGALAEWSAAPGAAPAARESLAQQALELLRELERRSPRALGPIRAQARLLAQPEPHARPDSGAARDRLRRAVEAYERAIALYPSEPRLRIEAAEAALRLWQQVPDVETADRARGHLAAALRIDATRKADAAVKLTDAELARIKAAQAGLQP